MKSVTAMIGPSVWFKRSASNGCGTEHNPDSRPQCHPGSDEGRTPQSHTDDESYTSACHESVGDPQGPSIISCHESDSHRRNSRHHGDWVDHSPSLSPLVGCLDSGRSLVTVRG